MRSEAASPDPLSLELTPELGEEPECWDRRGLLGSVKEVVCPEDPFSVSVVRDGVLDFCDRG